MLELEPKPVSMPMPDMAWALTNGRRTARRTVRVVTAIGREIGPRSSTARRLSLGKFPKFYLSRVARHVLVDLQLEPCVSGCSYGLRACP